LNLREVVHGAPLIGTLALAQTIVLRLGYVDPSLGPLAGLGAVAIARLNHDLGADFMLAVLIAVLLGLISGVLNGTIAAQTGTLPALGGSLGVFFALTYITDKLAGDRQLDVEVPTWATTSSAANSGAGLDFVGYLIVTVAVGCVLVLTRSPGGSRRTLDRSTRPSSIIVVSSYAAAGVVAAIAGALAVLATGTAAPVPETFTITALVAALLGGASVLGGFGGAGSALAGTTLLACVYGLFSLPGWAGDDVPTVLATVVIGVLCVLADVGRRRWALRQVAGNGPVAAVGAQQDTGPQIVEVERAVRSVGAVFARLAGGVVVWWVICIPEAAVMWFVVPDGASYRNVVFVGVYALTALIVLPIALLRHQ
jgi:ribose/xylose/arabinose/galactoside ABC-type transport system permease subunit